jgi:hypothetical protein
LGNNTSLRVLGLAGNDLEDSVLENVRWSVWFSAHLGLHHFSSRF